MLGAIEWKAPERENSKVWKEHSLSVQLGAGVWKLSEAGGRTTQEGESKQHPALTQAREE